MPPFSHHEGHEAHEGLKLLGYTGKRYWDQLLSQIILDSYNLLVQYFDTRLCLPRSSKLIREGLKLPKGVHRKIPSLVRSLSGDKDIVALYALGSLAHDALKPLSDLDFGMLLSERIDKSQRFQKNLDLIGLFTDFFKTEEIDLINMRDAAPRIAYNIMKTGKLLFCNDKSELTNFREQTVKSYIDFKDIRDRFDAEFLMGVGYHG
jgi:hypothetical protein